MIRWLEKQSLAADGDHEMDRRQILTMFGFTSGLCLMFTLTGCTAWSEERQRHYSWLYEKCMHGEREPYTIHMNPKHNSPRAQRCQEEYSHYVGHQPSAPAKTHPADRRPAAGFEISQRDIVEKATSESAIPF